MSTKMKNRLTVCLAAVFFLGFAVWCLVKAPDEISESERRKLATMPEFKMEDVASGAFMTSFESYATDQFPLRDGFRTLSAVYSRYVARQKDVDGIYTYGGYVSAINYPLNRPSMDNAAAKFRGIYDNLLAGSAKGVYFSVIPDKNEFMAASGVPTIEFEDMVDYMKEKMDFAGYIDIASTLGLESYYKTDTHWRQEKLSAAAEALVEGMGASLPQTDHSVNTFPAPFLGVYGGQSALPHPKEELCYVTSDLIDNFQVYDFETGSEIAVYDLEKAAGVDGYDIFLSGPRSLQTITNPAGDPDKKLVIFRDSFGSSIAPLIAEAYGQVTLVDIRYLGSDFVGRFVDFTGCDVLFLYSELVLNDSTVLK